MVWLCVQIYLFIIIYIFYLLGVLWASWTCGFYLLLIVENPQSLSFKYFFRNSITLILDHLILTQCLYALLFVWDLFCFVLPFFFHFFVSWIIFTDILSSSMIPSSIVCSLLISLSKKFFNTLSFLPFSLYYVLNSHISSCKFCPPFLLYPLTFQSQLFLSYFLIISTYGSSFCAIYFISWQWFCFLLLFLYVLFFLTICVDIT